MYRKKTEYKKKLNIALTLKTMSLSTVPDLYSPNVDEFGSYTDHIPSFTNGIKCPCGFRKDKFFSSSANFASHQKTKFHQ